MNHRADEELGDGSWKVIRSESAKHQEKKKHMNIKERRERADKFDAFYKTLGSKCRQEQKRIDFVLVYPNKSEKEIEDEEDILEFRRQNDLREKFEEALKEEGLQKQKVAIDDKIYTKIHCPFRRLCEEAETVSLEMPLDGVSLLLLLCCFYTPV